MEARRTFCDLSTRVRREEQGIGIVLAVSVTAIVFIFAFSWQQMATHQVGISAVQRNREQAVQAAEAGAHKAITLLTEQPSLASVPLTSINQGSNTFGEYEATITTPDPFVYPNVRSITSTGYAPSKTAANVRVRKIQAEVELLATNSFEFALFASGTAAPSSVNTVEGDALISVTGDIFAGGVATWGAGSSIAGNVSTWGGITSRGTVTGTLHTAGVFGGCFGGGGPTCSVAIYSGAVNGDVMVTDDTATGITEGRVDVWAVSPTDGQPRITGNVTTLASPPTAISSTWSPPISGTVSSLQSLPPPKYVLPSFSWGSYQAGCGCTPTVHSLPSPVAAWQTHFKTFYLTPGISGTHEITGGGSGTVELGGANLVNLPITAWNMIGDVVIYTDRPVKLSADVLNPGGLPKKLVIISTFSGGPDAVTFDGAVSIPSSVEILVYAPNDQVQADGAAQTMKGSIYAESIKLWDNFSIGEGTTLNTVPGFTWPMITYAPVRTLLFKEAP